MTPMTHPYLSGSEPVMVLAHRGGRSEKHPENTIAAFQEALLHGASSIETDVHLSKDGVLIASHDAKVGGLVIPKTHSQHIAEHKEGAVELYPKLVDVIEQLPDTTKLNIDPKSGRAADALCSLLHARPRLLERICVGAFFDGRINMLRRQFGTALCTSMGPREAAMFLSTGRTNANVAQLPLRLFGRQIVTERVAEMCSNKGIELHVWTLNTAEEMQEAVDLGATGVVTDEVELAVSLFSR